MNINITCMPVLEGPNPDSKAALDLMNRKKIHLYTGAHGAYVSMLKMLAFTLLL